MSDQNIKAANKNALASHPAKTSVSMVLCMHGLNINWSLNVWP